MGREKPGAPALGATIINRRQRWIWVNTCRSGVISLVIRCGPSMASLADDGERRWSVSARMSTEPGSKTWCSTLTIYIKAFQMLVLMNLMRPSLSTTRVIAMTILQLIAEKRPMIPTIVSCMHLNFNYIYIYSHYCSNYCCIINSFSHSTNYFILILVRFVTDMEGETSGS